jgi:hypothetical protein
MSDLQFKERMNKASFEARIVSELGGQGMTKCQYKEHGAGETVTTMTLYYKDGAHCGTWQGGQGWAFKSAYH